MKSKIFFYNKIFSDFKKTATYNSICGAFYVSIGPWIILCLAITVVFIVYLFGFGNIYAEVHNEGEPENILSNGSFEEGIYSPAASPISWTWDPWQPSAIPTWDDTQAQTGGKSVTIYAPTPNDARWIQTVDVEPNKLYFLSGWIKTDNVGHTAESVDAGANFSLFGTWTHSAGVFGTRDWTRNGILFNSGIDVQVTVGARLGYWAGTTTGTAWFDDLELKPIVPMDPHPSWKILVLIYQETDFEVTDHSGTYHHYVSSITQDELEQAALAAKQFVEIDIPALTSGNMVPEITVRFPGRALNELSSIGEGWWPSPEDTAPERDPEFDSVIVIWDPRATDLETNNYKWIGYGDGLAANRGTGQTYFSMQLDAAVYRGHRNVFKHEWGHCILFFFEAVGTTPKPTVSNHADAMDYVNCKTEQFYVWRDETLAYPIPYSIYNIESGFTHDYYSGMTATADHPSRCLGVTPEAWTLGGPVSHSGNMGCSLPLGHLDYCLDCGPCAEGEGDCDSDSECENGLTCDQIPGEVDVCEAFDVCPHPIGHWDYCRDCGLCTVGQGDCDSDRECMSGLLCAQSPGAADFCCPYPIGHWDYCRDCGPCGAGQGDCDLDSECQSGMVCAQILGAADVCCPYPIGHWDYCRDCGPCDLGQGDCDSDVECRVGLVCAQVIGSVDVCEY